MNNKSDWIKWVFLLSLLGLLMPSAVWAQEDEPTVEDEVFIPQVYVVVAGDTLSSIATQFGVTVEAIQTANNIADPTLIFLGQELLIPDARGIPVATDYLVSLGDTVANVAIQFNTTPQALAESNFLLNPKQLIIGQTLDVTSKTGSATPQAVTGASHLVQDGDTWLGVAVNAGISPLQLTPDLNIPLQSGQRLRLPSEATFQDLGGEWKTVQVDGLPAAQGSTLSIYVENLLPGEPNGSFDELPLRFAPEGEGYVAMLGIDAFENAGIHTLTISGSGNRPWTPLSQPITINPVFYGTNAITVTNLPDLDARIAENELLQSLYTHFTPNRLWDGLFQEPVSPTLPITTGYGEARSYNSGPYDSFHSGTDFAGFAGTPIYAPANAIVHFAEPVTVRGNIVILDHGLGVMTGYYHLSVIHVQTGDTVTQGQLIGEIGTTGLSTGPHLHWDLRILNQAVNPLLWTIQEFP